jgi:hypothetical protein
MKNTQQLGEVKTRAKDGSAWSSHVGTESAITAVGGMIDSSHDSNISRCLITVGRRPSTLPRIRPSRGHSTTLAVSNDPVVSTGRFNAAVNAPQRRC